MYDLGSFPGIIHGKDVIYGQAIIFEEGVLKEIIRTFDAIEGFYNEGNKDNLYNREIIHINVDGSIKEAVAYFFNDIEDIKRTGTYIKEGFWGEKKCMVRSMGM